MSRAFLHGWRDSQPTPWSLFQEPVEGGSSEVEAYRAGLRAWWRDRDAGRPMGLTVRYRRRSDALAYLAGYRDGGAAGRGAVHAGGTMTREDVLAQLEQLHRDLTPRLVVPPTAAVVRHLAALAAAVDMLRAPVAGLCWYGATTADGVSRCVRPVGHTGDHDWVRYTP